MHRRKNLTEIKFYFQKLIFAFKNISARARPIITKNTFGGEF